MVRKAGVPTVVLVLTLICFFVICPAQERKQQVSPENARTSALRKQVDSRIDTLSPRMIEISDWMYKNPEPGFVEFKSAAMLSDELKKHGFEVTMGVPGLEVGFDRLKIIGGLPADYSGPTGLPTAFKAKYKGKSEHPVIGIMVEYDALRGNPPFHGCQHNMQGPTGVGAAIALAQVMEENKLPGSIWVIGAPAEEVGPPTKAAQARAGYYDGIDAMLRSHGTSRETLHYPAGFSSRNIRQMKYTFHGRSAHAQSAWEGRSALDAVLLLFHSVDMIREHSEPQFRFHGIVSEGGVAPNIVPELASATMWIRHIIDQTPVGAISPKKSGKMIDDKVAELDNMAKGAALATGTTVDIDHYGSYVPGVSVGVLNDVAFQYAVDYGGIKAGQRQVPNDWEETGYGTLVVPGVHIAVGTEGIPEVPGHSKENADISISPAGHNSLVLTSKVMAAVALRLLTDEAMLRQCKAEHAQLVQKYNQ